MGALTNLLRPETETRETYLDQMMSWSLGSTSTSGVKVSEEGSLTYSAVWACVRVLSESLASLPLILYEQNGETRERAAEHSLYFLLKEQPNPEMTSIEFRELLVSHMCTWGNGLAEIETNFSGKVTALWPLRPDKVEKLERIDGQIVYWYRKPDQKLHGLPASRVMHWKGLGRAGMWGWSPVRLHMESIGLGLGTQEFGARFFGNGARPGMVLRHPGRLTPEAYARLKNSFEAEHGGLSNAHRVKILEEGLDVTTIGVPPEEAQFLETRKFQVTEIARIFRVPPHMLADLERSTYSNIEHQGIDFVAYTLRPWMVRIEQAIQRDLLSKSERKRYFVKHLADALLRGDTMTRSQAYSTQIQTGVLTPNEARRMEDRNPIDGGDELYMPLNLAPMGSVPVPKEPKLLPPSDGEADSERSASPRGTVEQRYIELRLARVKVINNYIRLYEEAAGRLVKREVADIRRAMPKRLEKGSIEEFAEWLAGFYEDLRVVTPDYFRAVMLALAEAMLASVAVEVGGDEPEIESEWAETYLTNFASVYTVGGDKQLNALLADIEPEEDETEKEAAVRVVNERLDGWENNRAQKTALDQAFEAGNAIALAGMVVMGVKEKVWAGGDCPLCRKMNGIRVAVEKPFLEKGDTLTVEDEDTADFPLVRTIGHPPLHAGCDCVILAG